MTEVRMSIKSALILNLTTFIYLFICLKLTSNLSNHGRHNIVTFVKKYERLIPNTKVLFFHTLLFVFVFVSVHVFLRMRARACEYLTPYNVSISQYPIFFYLVVRGAVRT